MSAARTAIRTIAGLIAKTTLKIPQPSLSLGPSERPRTASPIDLATNAATVSVRANLGGCSAGSAAGGGAPYFGSQPVGQVWIDAPGAAASTVKNDLQCCIDRPAEGSIWSKTGNKRRPKSR